MMCLKMKRFHYGAWVAALIALVTAACNGSDEAKADRLAGQGKTGEAIALYERAIEDGSLEAINKLALLYSNNLQPEKAKEYYHMAHEKGDRKATAYLANTSLKDHNYDDVVTYLKPLVDDGDTTQVYPLGWAYVELGRYEDAVACLLKNKDNVYVKGILGTAYYELDDLEQAEAVWKSAVNDHSSGGVNSYNKLLELYCEQGRTEDYEALEGRY
ncbi:tetratricopeptide repeat protein [Parapedobacter tibetensis]|uniref:tetratricopeptide repeat protein n=1 Tax=Parapedobacter tibetensis TaxID=2972951 RepID=UPI00214DD56B|nr:hypothetical protein [Parapedobacter tibetensis]